MPLSQRKSKVDGRASITPFDEEALNRVWRALNRADRIESLEELRNGLEPDRRPPLVESAAIALGFDTNAVFRLGLGGRGADAVDYVRKIHRGPLIIPGQTVQEIWNNQLSAVEPQAKKLRRRFDDLQQEMKVLGQSLGGAGVAVQEAVEELVSLHGDWIDPAAQSAFDAALDVLVDIGSMSYVPRVEFAHLARIRKETKTPPGFQDPIGYGDFFVWADFLFGIASADSSSFEAVVFVTNDVKSDWSRNGVPHPVLVAEVRAIVDVPFRLWTLQEFQKYAGQYSAVGDIEV